jgi:excisionase family DNA binding protein
MHKAEIAELDANYAGWLTAHEAAAYLKVRTRTLLLWTRQKKVLGWPLSGIRRRIWRFRKTDLDAVLFAQAEGVISSQSPSVLVTRGE